MQAEQDMLTAQAEQAAQDAQAALEVEQQAALESELEAARVQAELEYQAYLETLAVEMNAGINIGNALDAPADEDWGVVMDASYFAAIAVAGFDTVRLPVRFSDYTDAQNGYLLDEAFMLELDGYIDTALSQGLVVVLDLHHFVELMEDVDGNTEAYFAIWTQLSERYQDYPKELVFELLNEPNGALTAEIWNDLLAQSVALIRAQNPTRKIIVGGANWGSAEAVLLLELPEDDHLIISFHYYDPMEFTFQGNQDHAGYVEMTGIDWTGTEEELAAIDDAFAQVYVFAQENNADVFLGEFGVTQGVAQDATVRWVSAVVEAANRYGFSYSYWELCSGFGIYVIETGRWEEEILGALVPEAVAE